MSTFLKTDLIGKIRNLPDFKSEVLLPIFEAVVNSIHAIEEAERINDGYIEIHIIRDGQKSLLSEKHDQQKIDGFEIIDNGIGFNDKNYDSFNTSDSTYKLNKGCKGIGHFLWLKAFKIAEIDSIYSNGDGKNHRRNFSFDANQGTSLIKSSEVDDLECKTNVKLTGFKADYRDAQSAYKTTDKIAQRILEHCLAYYISGNAPHIVIIDDSENKKVDLNQLFDKIKDSLLSECIIIKNEKFTIHHLRLFETHSDTHRIVYCANGRDVKSCSLQKAIGTKTQFDDYDKKYFYAAYITSKYLDDRVDAYRQAFNIPDKSVDLQFETISMEEIDVNVITRIKKLLSPILDDISIRKKEMVDNYVADENPMLRAVVKHCPEALDEIELNSSTDKICEVLYVHKGKVELDIKRRSEKLLKTQSTSIEEIDQEYKEIVEQLDDFQRDELAGYVVRRKLIIDLLEKKLNINKDGKYHNEDIIHDIIFPRKTNSDIINFEDHNLWLIDDTLAFHRFASSDNQFKDISTSLSEERPDIVIFAEVGDDKNARAVSLVEFKKPQRTNFDEDPTKQLYRYVRKIRQNKKFRTGNGRDIAVMDETRFYCYAICDITKPIVEFTENNNYAKLQGEFGYYLYNRNHNAHTTIVAFDKLVIDAKKRHKAFFDKLGL